MSGTNQTAAALYNTFKPTAAGGAIKSAQNMEDMIATFLARTPIPSVTWAEHGAALNGTTVDDAAFNAARTTAGDNGIVVVPRGGINLTGTPTGGSTSPILWQLSGNAFGTGTTPVNGIGADTVETTLTGAKFFTRTGTIPDAAPVLRIDSAMTHTTGGSGGTISTLLVNTSASSANPNNSAWGITSVLHSLSTGLQQNAALVAYGYKDANGAQVWGANIAVADTTGHNSITSGPLVANEQGIGANGTDTGSGAVGSLPGGLGIRVNHDMVFVKQNPAGADAVFGWGARIGSGGGVSIDFPFSVYNVVVNKAAFDTEYATITGSADAFRMAPDQTIGFDGASGNIKLYYTNIGGANALVETAPALLLNNATSNRIVYAAAGLGPPTFTTQSAGTKITLFPALSGSSVDYSMGVEGGALWSAVGTTANGFNWYAGTTLVGSLTGAGVHNVTGSYQVAGTKVVGARDTGWTAMTGTPDKATAYATGSVTLAQLAGRVAQLQASLTTHGLIGT